MYFKFYDFNEPPFNLTPNSRFFFSSAKHMEALSTLLYAINERKGFVVITGDIGSGKTTVCRALINQLDTDTQTALITNTRMSGRDLLMSILEDFEVDYVPGSKSKLHSQLNDYLIDQLRNDRNVVLIIDEAQNLSPAVLEEVRMLSNLETENEKLIQIIFLGQPELKKKLALPELEQLRQRIAVYFHLTPLSQEDTFKYIIHRLLIASKSNRKYFTDDALQLIYKYSKGIPRLINQICDSAFLTGYINEQEVIDSKILKEVIKESPMIQLSDIDKNKFFKNEESDQDVLDFKEESSRESRKERGFSISDKYIAELDIQHEDEGDDEEDENDLIDEDESLSGYQQTKRVDNVIFDRGEETDTRTHEIESEQDIPSEASNMVEKIEIEEEIDERKEYKDNQEEKKEYSLDQIDAFQERGFFMLNKFPIAMMILFSIFIVASIVVFYQVI